MSRLTQKRAAYLWENRGYQNALPINFALKAAWPGIFEHTTPRPDGMTLEEDRHVRLVWNTMDGNRNYMDAFWRILRGEEK